ncbi:3581_t:CDS:10, partial [Racocetra persica]
MESVLNNGGQYAEGDLPNVTSSLFMSYASNNQSCFEAQNAKEPGYPAQGDSFTNDDPNISANYGKDLVEHIPGLYRLLDLCKDDGSNGLVDKIIISKDSLKNLCNEMVPHSFVSISEIEYDRLNVISFRLIGCYGNNAIIAKLLLKKNIINQKIFDSLTMSYSSESDQEVAHQLTLRAGIYLLIINHDLGLVIHWSEKGCYEENASSQRKKNMTNLHKYLTKLTDNQICFMSEKDLENFDFSMVNEEQGPFDEKNNMCYEFEVKKSQEEKEDFKLYPGFTVDLPFNVKRDLKNNGDAEILLTPIGIYNSLCIYSYRIVPTSIMRKKTFHFPGRTFKQDLQFRLQGLTLEISRNMSMKSLELLVKNGLDMEKELMSPLKDAIALATKENDSKKEQEMHDIKIDVEYITAMSRKMLKELYSEFEQLSDKASSAQIEIDNTERIENIIQINSEAWKKMKRRYYIFTALIAELAVVNKSGSDKHNAEIILKSLPSILIDEENDLQKLFEKYFDAQKGFIGTFVSFFTYENSDDVSKLKFDDININALYTRATELLNNQDDCNFIKRLFETNLFDSCEEIRRKILNSFFDEYSNWREKTFSRKIKDILPKFSDRSKEITSRLEKELMMLKRDIEKREFEIICQKVEGKYPINYYRTSFDFIVEAEIEAIQPVKLQINIYETSLDQSEAFELKEKEFYVPKPIFPTNNNHKSTGISFLIDPEVYDLRKISQFENKRFFIILWNKKQRRYEIFYDVASRLTAIFNSNSLKPFKRLNSSEHCLFAINEPRGLIGIYDIKSGVLNVYAFDEQYIRWFPRYTNVQILQWYNYLAPDIQHFFFIKDTEDICFVEVGGRARIYNLVSGQFRPGIGHIPANTANVMSTPDGACIVAFVKEKVQTELSFEESNLNLTNEHSVTNIIEKCFAHIYFCSNFGSHVKVIEMPSFMKFPEYSTFSFVQKRQMHITTLDLEKCLLCSSIVKITLEKTQYRFQQRSRRSLEEARLQNTDLSIIEGKNTNFTKDIRKGDNIVLSSQKYRVKEILSDTLLKISEVVKPVADNDWVEFGIEPQINLNRLIDVYKSTFEKYQIDNFIDPEQTKPLSLLIALDVQDNDKVEYYVDKFKDYVSEMFEELRRSTKKPATSLKKFTVNVATFNDFDIDDIKFKQENTTEYQLGEWIIQLSVLIPIQIAVARNNIFIPLRDGLSSEVEQGEPDDEYARHIDAIAQNISFGWYEGIFKYFENRQVKVVSSMGEQSCGKSYMLNHLVGTTFDGSAMRCTEGVWMSLAITKKYIYVALDFEGLKSLERTPQEDLFLTLFNTVVSNMILFKNQFAVNRDMSTMFQRFQDSATLFESDPKIFQAKLCIIIKDVPKQDRDDIVREFSLKFNALVAEEGENNFITRMYPSGLSIIPWPIFNDPAWFKSLIDIKRLLDKQQPKYENARTFLQNTKVIMAKLKICDWGSLDENLVQIRISTLKRFLPAAISLGVEKKYPTTEFLL